MEDSDEVLDKSGLSSYGIYLTFEDVIEYIKSLHNQTCPLLQEPLEDCYCVNLSCQAIGKAVYYCSQNFTQCEIYRTKNKP